MHYFDFEKDTRTNSTLPNFTTSSTDMDSLVQGTNDSSILSKFSMVRRGYFQDDFIQHFVTKDVRRAPLINLGYFARAMVMDRSIRMFLETVEPSKPQILSLGAGFDTTFFRLYLAYPDISYFEVDLPDVVRNKISVIKHSDDLRTSLSKDIDDAGPDCLSTPRYSIFSHDLSTTEGLAEKLELLGFDFDRPTLVFSECAITYIEEIRSTKLIMWAAKNLPNGTFMNYEQCRPSDGFGQVMISHFNKIQNPLRSVSSYQTIHDQKQRYLTAGWTHCQTISVMELLGQFMNPSEYLKIFQTEPFDEWEEFHLKCCHYSLSVASHTASFVSKFQPSDGANVQYDGIVEAEMENVQVERFAHSVGLISDGAALIFGGFGASLGNVHTRCTEVQYIGTQPKKVRLYPESHFGVMDCLHHSCTTVGKAEFILYGGRTSPAREVNGDPLLLSVIADNGNFLDVKVQKLTVESEKKPPPRWRHTAVLFQGSVLVFGGRNRNMEVFGDLWELKPDGNGSWMWREIPHNQNTRWPVPRFSHACTSADSALYVSGGLDSNFRPLSDVWEMTKTGGELTWKQLELKNALPVYSHKMHYYQNQLILVGGVNESESQQHQLSSIDLFSLTAHNFNLKIPEENCPHLLHNFDSYISSDEAAIICHGGGGNCFSFGTHFNKFSVKLPLDRIVVNR